MNKYITNKDGSAEIELTNWEVITLDKLYSYEPPPNVKNGQYFVAEPCGVNTETITSYATLEEARSYIESAELDMFKLTYNWS